MSCNSFKRGREKPSPCPHHKADPWQINSKVPGWLSQEDAEAEADQIIPESSKLH